MNERGVTVPSSLTHEKVAASDVFVAQAGCQSDRRLHQPERIDGQSHLKTADPAPGRLRGGARVRKMTITTRTASFPAPDRLRRGNGQPAAHRNAPADHSVAGDHLTDEQGGALQLSLHVQRNPFLAVADGRRAPRLRFLNSAQCDGVRQTRASTRCYFSTPRDSFPDSAHSWCFRSGHWDIECNFLDGEARYFRVVTDCRD